MRGCDFAWGVVPGREHELAKALKREGFGFVVRYLSSDPSKNLTRAEVKAYKAVGLHIVTVFEDAAAALLGGRTTGRGMAVESKQQLATLGAPEHAPVYFAADFPVTPEQMPALDAALDGTAFVLTEELNGIYGSYAAVSQARHVHYKWQTVAWSAGMWSPSDHIRQFATGGVTDRVQWDLDEAMVADFGQWIWPKEKPLAPPAPKKHPVKRVAHKVKAAVKKTHAAAKHTVTHEPVVTGAGAAGGLAAFVAFIAAHLGLHLTATEMHYTLTALTALATLFAAVRTRPVAVTAIPGALATIAVAALAFHFRWPASVIATDTAMVAAGLSVVLRQGVSPKVVSADVTWVAADVERLVDKIGAVLHRASQVTPPVTVHVPVPASVASGVPSASLQSAQVTINAPAEAAVAAPVVAASSPPPFLVAPPPSH